MAGPILRDPGPIRDPGILRSNDYKRAYNQMQQEAISVAAEEFNTGLLNTTKSSLPDPVIPEGFLTTTTMPGIERKPVQGTPVFSSEKDFMKVQQEASTLADTTPIGPFTPYRPGFKVDTTLKTTPSVSQKPTGLIHTYESPIPRTASFDFNTYARNLVAQESSGNVRARNPRSSAIGHHQFLEGTFVSTVKKYHPDLAKNKTYRQIAALRTDAEISNKVFESLSKENKRILDRYNIPTTYGTMYAAHFAGPVKAARLYVADPNSPISAYFSNKEIRANPHLRGMTVNDFWKWAAGAMQR